MIWLCALCGVFCGSTWGDVGEVAPAESSWQGLSETIRWKRWNKGPLCHLLSNPAGFPAPCKCVQLVPCHHHPSRKKAHVLFIPLLIFCTSYHHYFMFCIIFLFWLPAPTNSLLVHANALVTPAQPIAVGSSCFGLDMAAFELPALWIHVDHQLWSMF